MKTPIELIAEERQRQIEVEGWTPEHDDEHRNGELAKAAGCYALMEDARSLKHDMEVPFPFWPWEKEFWKPTPENRIKELVKAGALIDAEIARLQRLELQETQNPKQWN